MAIPVIMPRQGQSVETCILTTIYKEPGEQVSKGDLLFAYETDKASFEEEAPEDGTFLGAFFEEGDEIPVLETVCVLGKEGEDISSFAPEGESKESETTEPEEPQTKEATTPESKTVSSGDENGKIKISPRARKKAELNNVPFNKLSGSGPNGRILDRDVEEFLSKEPAASEQKSTKTPAPEPQKQAATPPPAAPVQSGDYEIRPQTNIRKIIAKAMHNSLQSSAQLTHHLSADARALLACRKKSKAKANESNGSGLTLNDFICYATIQALKQYPQVNAHLQDEQLKVFKGIHLGLAVDTERGLMVPVIKNADDLNINGLSRKMREIAEACRTGNIDPSLIAPDAASFTVSNLGNYGVEMFTPVINLPQVAILGVNTVIYRPAPQEDGTIAIVPHLGLSLTYDHRALDGGEATRFVKEVANQIENLHPDELTG